MRESTLVKIEPQPRYDMSRQKKAVAFVRDYVRRSEFGAYVRKMIVYGSFARGTGQYDSDVDILLELDEQAKSVADYRRRILEMISVAHAQPQEIAEADIRVEFGSSWETRKTQFYRNVQEDGYDIWN